MGWKDEIAKQVAGAEIFGGGNYFTDGQYEVRVKSLLFKSGHKGESFIGEFFVESAAPTEPGVEPNAVGSCASVAYNVTKHKNMALGNIKALALALAGMTEAELSAQQDAENQRAAAEGRQARNILELWLLRATNENSSDGTIQPLRGKKVRASTYRKARRGEEDKPRSTWPTYVKFEAVPGQTPESIAEGRKIVESASVVSTPAPTPAPQPATPPPAAPAPASAGGETPSSPPAGPGLLDGLF